MSNEPENCPPAEAGSSARTSFYWYSNEHKPPYSRVFHDTETGKGYGRPESEKIFKPFHAPLVKKQMVTWESIHFRKLDTAWPLMTVAFLSLKFFEAIISPCCSHSTHASASVAADGFRQDLSAMVAHQRSPTIPLGRIGNTNGDFYNIFYPPNLPQRHSAENDVAVRESYFLHAMVEVMY
ncbi:hypothetical protein C8R44DRAFT_727976 [Mycena epipterygia]|nr:hypothetical protein C8R44DRAFT_727976 [Mycena epipterygia]